MCQPLLISLRPPNSSPSFCLFKHAYTLILTRAFHVDSTYHRLSLVPLACSFNHEQEGESNVQFVVEEEWVCGECGRARACPHDSDNDSQDAMVEERGQGEETWCEMVTTSPVAKGEELFNHYGPRLSNAKLLVSYGFLLEANEHDRLNFDLSDVFDPNLGVEDAETGDPNLGVEDAETGEVEKCWRELLNLCRVSEFKAALEEDHPLVSQPRPLESPHALYADADARLSSPLFLLLAVSVFSTSPSTASVSMNVEKVTKILEAASRCDEGALEGQEEEEESETVTVLHRISERLRKLISRRRAGQNYPNLDAARLLEMAEAPHAPSDTRMASLALTPTPRQEALLEFSALGEGDACPLGMWVWPVGVFEWHITFFLHRGYYAHSILRLRLQIPQSYPSTPPQILFDSQVFHPLIDPVSGLMRLDSRFPTWRPRRDFLSHVLHFVKSSFKRKGLDGLREVQCANLEAYRIYRTNPPLFARLASQSASLSTSSSILYSPPIPRSVDAEPSPVRFRQLEKGEEERLRERVREEGERKVVRRVTGGVEGGGVVGSGIGRAGVEGERRRREKKQSQESID
ncbi:hypothetical protein JCM11641_005275 [Rhodosporidiobolus odoratus]